MRFIQNVKGVSRLVLLLMLIVSFLLGATLSYIFTLGFYAPNEYKLPNQKTLTIENVEFSPQDATSFNVTVLNPSYSLSNVSVVAVQVETQDGKLHDALTSSLPYSLAVGASKTFQSFWNWGNYTGQPVQVLAFISNGVGPNLQAVTPHMNLSITSIDFIPSFTADNFTITVQNSGSPIPVNITKILVDGIEYPTEPSLTAEPYALTNASTATPVTFVLEKKWDVLQGQSVTASVQTLQGHAAYKTVTAPQVFLNITGGSFNRAISTSQFNVTVLNAPYSAADLNISEVTVYVPDNMTEPKRIDWTAYYNNTVTTTLRRSVTFTLIACIWDWSVYHPNQTVIVTIGTAQDFQTFRQFQIPP